MKIVVSYDDRQRNYRASVSLRGRNLWSGRTGAPWLSAADLTTPSAYDAAARDALVSAVRHGAHADDYTVSDHADYGRDGTGYLVRRSEKHPGGARRPAASSRSRATRPNHHGGYHAPGDPLGNYERKAVIRSSSGKDRVVTFQRAMRQPGGIIMLDPGGKGPASARTMMFVRESSLKSIEGPIENL